MNGFPRTMFMMGDNKIPLAFLPFPQIVKMVWWLLAELGPVFGSQTVWWFQRLNKAGAICLMVHQIEAGRRWKGSREGWMDLTWLLQIICCTVCAPYLPLKRRLILQKGALLSWLFVLRNVSYRLNSKSLFLQFMMLCSLGVTMRGLLQKNKSLNFHHWKVPVS